MATTTSIPQGRGLLRDPRFNRGTAFTAEDRTALGLEGLLPATVLSLEEQAERSYEQYRAQPTDLARNEFLAALHDRNEVLYDKASAIAHKADDEGTTLREAALALGVTAADFDRVVDPKTMVGDPRDLGLTQANVRTRR